MSELTELATEKFNREIERAKQRGVDVDRVFVECQGRRLIQKVQAFGLCCAILATVIWPVAMYGLKYHSLIHGFKLDLPEGTILTFCLASLGAMITFGYRGGQKASSAVAKQHLLEDKQEP